jgi:hypothetical protein
MRLCPTCPVDGRVYSPENAYETLQSIYVRWLDERNILDTDAWIG